MDRGFARVDADLRDLRTEMNVRFDAVDRKFDAVDHKFDAINARFDEMHRTLIGMHRTLVQAAVGVIAAFGAALIGLVATQL